MPILPAVEPGQLQRAPGSSKWHLSTRRQKASRCVLPAPAREKEEEAGAAEEEEEEEEEREGD